MRSLSERLHNRRSYYGDQPRYDGEERCCGANLSEGLTGAGMICHGSYEEKEGKSIFKCQFFRKLE